MSKSKIYLSLLIATTVAYFGSVKYGFSQDDWYFLSISTARNITEVLGFFNPFTQAGFAFYRPLGTQLYYYLARATLGIQSAPVGMHLFMLIIQSISAYNVFRLSKKLTGNQLLSLLTSLIYATSSVHFLSLYYIAATQQLLAAMFSLLALNDYLEHKSIRSSIWLALALLSKEIAIMTPCLMLLAHLKISPKWQLKKIIASLLPAAVVTLLYLALRLFGGVHVQSEYHLIFNGSTLGTLRWYFLFGYGTPEELVRYGLPRLGVNLLRFIHDYGFKGVVAGIVPILFSMYALIHGWRKWLYFCWWFVALLPVMFLANHRYPHYVDLALIPLILLVLENHKPKVQMLLAGVLIVTSLISINLSVLSHWTVKRALMASSAVKVITARNDCSSPNWYIIGEGESAKQLSYTLSLENGPRVICDNPLLRVYYQGMSEGSIPQGVHLVSTNGIDGL